MPDESTSPCSATPPQIRVDHPTSCAPSGWWRRCRRTTLWPAATPSLAALSESTFVTHPSGQRSAMFDTVVAGVSKCRLPARSDRRGAGDSDARDFRSCRYRRSTGARARAITRPGGCRLSNRSRDVDQSTDLALATRAGELSAAVARVVEVITAVTAEGEGQQASPTSQP